MPSLNTARARTLAALALTTVLSTGCLNVAPTETSATITTAEDTASTGVTPKVVDANKDDTFTFTIVTQPANGSAAVVANKLVYTPEADFNGPDSFTYKVTDAGGESLVGTAQVTVSAVNDPITATGGGRTVFVDAAGSRKPWVEDVDLFDTATVTITQQPSLGSASSDGSRWTYTPNSAASAASAIESDSFKYRVVDSSTPAASGVIGTARVRLYDTPALAECRRNSQVNPDGTLKSEARTKSNSCAFYASVATRTSASGVPITMDYLSLRPTDDIAPKAIVLLIGGGDFNMNLTGDATTGVPATSGGGNFLVRSAQLVADAGYQAIAIDRPSDLPLDGSVDDVVDADKYRLTVQHAVDLVGVLRRINVDNLPVFFVGTSRGALSAVAQNRLATAIGLPSPVTSVSNLYPDRLYVTRADTPSLQPSVVRRPVWVGWNQSDLCSVAKPANSAALAVAFVNAPASAPTATSQMFGGVRVFKESTLANGTKIEVDVCGAYDFHGFLGIENAAIAGLTPWLDARVAALGSNKRPETSYASFGVAPGATRKIDLSRLARDANGDPLTFELSHPLTTLGGEVSVTGSTVTYKAPAGVSNRSDQFVYIVTDGQGGVSAAVITVKIGI